MDLLPFQLPLVPCTLRYPAKRNPRLRARVAGRWLCCCDDRVVKRYAAHPPRAGGPTTKLDLASSGQEFAGRSGRPGELGQGGDSAFRPREARERQQIRASGKAFVRSTKSSCALHGFASDVCWRVSRGTPLPSPGRHAPTPLLPPARFPTHSPALAGRPFPAARSKRPRRPPGPLSHHLSPWPGGSLAAWSNPPQHFLFEEISGTPGTPRREPPGPPEKRAPRRAPCTPAHFVLK